MSADPSQTSQPAWRRHTGAIAAGAVILLAVTETVSALVAPWRAPSDADWQAAAAEVRQGFQARDLVVAAPGWADPVMRMHLGDLVPVSMAGRLDAVRFGRVWEISQRGARAADADGTLIRTSRHGNLTVRLYERPAAQITFDFVEQWANARVTRVTAGAGDAVVCAPTADRHQCPDRAWNFVKPEVLEIDHTLRRSLYAQPVAGAVMAVEYPAVPMGRELVVASGLHNVWYRKAGQGTVDLRVLVDDQLLTQQIAGNRSGFRIDRIDTTAFAGRTVPVRFEISSDEPYARHFGFAAEARDP